MALSSDVRIPFILLLPSSLLSSAVSPSACHQYQMCGRRAADTSPATSALLDDTLLFSRMTRGEQICACLYFLSLSVSGKQV